MTTDQRIETLASLALKLTEDDPENMPPKREGFVHGVVTALGCLLGNEDETELSSEMMLLWGSVGYANLMVRKTKQNGQVK